MHLKIHAADLTMFSVHWLLFKIDESIRTFASRLNLIACLHFIFILAEPNSASMQIKSNQWNQISANKSIFIVRSFVHPTTSCITICWLMINRYFACNNCFNLKIFFPENNFLIHIWIWMLHTSRIRFKNVWILWKIFQIFTFCACNRFEFDLSCIRNSPNEIV